MQARHGPCDFEELLCCLGAYPQSLCWISTIAISDNPYNPLNTSQYVSNVHSSIVKFFLVFLIILSNISQYRAICLNPPLKISILALYLKKRIVKYRPVVDLVPKCLWQLQAVLLGSIPCPVIP